MSVRQMLGMQLLCRTKTYARKVASIASQQAWLYCFWGLLRNYVLKLYQCFSLFNFTFLFNFFATLMLHVLLRSANSQEYIH